VLDNPTHLETWFSKHVEKKFRNANVRNVPFFGLYPILSKSRLGGGGVEENIGVCQIDICQNNKTDLLNDIMK
jgi:hypothetical protein